MNLKKRLIKKISGNTYPYTKLQKELRNFALMNYPKSETYSDPIDIVLLTLNRLEDTKRTIDSIYQTTLPFNLIIIDQASTDGTREFLQELVSEKMNINLHLLEENKGVSGGRSLAVQHSENEYLAFIDNDMIFAPGYFENLLSTLKSDSNLAGSVAKTVLPNRLLEVNSPTYSIEDDWIIFKDLDSGKRYDHADTLESKKCPWVPMGVSMWRTQVLKEIPIDADLIGAYEDNDYTYRVGKAGYKFMNCPSSIVLHIKAEFTKAMEDKTYTQGRFNTDKLKFAVRHFYKKHGLYLAFGDIEGSCKYFGFGTPQDLIDFVTAE